MQTTMHAWTITGPVALHGTVEVEGAKNGVLVAMSSLLLTRGVSVLHRVPPLTDVMQICTLLEAVGAKIQYDEPARTLTVDTSQVHAEEFSEQFLHAIQGVRAASLLMGPLLARYGRARLPLAKGCNLGMRPLDFHVRVFQKMGASVAVEGDWLVVSAPVLRPVTCILEYPSVGATENALLAAAFIEGTTTIYNAAIEPEVIDLAALLRKMGARVTLLAPATIQIEGTTALQPVEHTILPDRLEAGTFLIGAAVTGGAVTVPDIDPHELTLVLEKLGDMGHHVSIGEQGRGVSVQATSSPRAVSWRTMPYPGFPTDLQSIMMVAQLVATGKSDVMETVFENRMTHVPELQKMGAHILLHNRLEATTAGSVLYGAEVHAPNIRAGAALVLAGCAARGVTRVTGIEHLLRGYVRLADKLCSLGAQIVC